jgi:DNA replication protein DnaC
VARRLRFAHLKERGVINDIDYQHPRGMDRKPDAHAGQQRMVPPASNLLLPGPAGIGSWLGCAMAQKACCNGFSVLHKRTSELFRAVTGIARR